MATLKERIVQIPQKLAEMLAGTPQQDEALPQNIVYSAEARETLDPANMQPTLQLGTKTTPARNGFLQDFMAGAKENYNNAFTPENLQPQNKNWATRLGEGLGTALRFGDSSWGRGLMAGGAALALGMSPGQALGYGLGTTAGRQGILTADKVYRNQLKKMGVSEEDLNNIKGYVTNDVFKNASLANYRNKTTDYRNMKLDQDTYVKLQQNIYKMLDSGVISAEEATIQMQSLNDEFNKQNGITFQEGLKRTQGDRKLDQNERKISILEEKIKQGQATQEEKEEYYNLKNDKLRLEIEALEQENLRNNRNKPNKYIQNDYVQMQAPNGKIYKVPKTDIEKYKNAGGKVIG